MKIEVNIKLDGESIALLRKFLAAEANEYTYQIKEEATPKGEAAPPAVPATAPISPVDDFFSEPSEPAAEKTKEVAKPPKAEKAEKAPSAKDVTKAVHELIVAQGKNGRATFLSILKSFDIETVSVLAVERYNEFIAECRKHSKVG